MTLPFARFIVPSLKDQIRLAREEIMGYARRIARSTAFTNVLTVFAVFLAVCSPLQQSYSSLKGWYRTGTCRWHFSSGCCMVSSTAIRPCHTRSTFVNPGTVGNIEIFPQQVSGVVNQGIWFVIETGPSCTSTIRSPPKLSDLTRACYRCDKTAFFEVLALIGSTFLAQVVLTLRSVVVLAWA